MTTRCNLACTYCYLQGHSLPSQSINLEFAERGISDYFASSNNRHIRFFGAGEPTLEFQKIKAIRQFAYDRAGSALKVEIQTNGVFSVHIAEWLARNANIVWISCDGTPDLQDRLRPTSYGGTTSQVIERNIAILLRGGPELIVGIRSTITPLNLYRQTEMIEYYHALGISALFSDPVFPAVANANTGVKKLELDSDFMMVYAKEFLKAHKKARQLEMFYGSILTVNFDERSELFCRACLPSPHLTTDGYVSCCDMAFMGNILPQLVYGKYDPDNKTIVYDPKKLASIRLRRASNLLACRGCEVLFHCAGACFGEGLNETGFLLGVKKDYCEAIRFLAQEMDLNAGPYPYIHP